MAFQPLIPESEQITEAWGDLVPFSDYPTNDWPDVNGTMGSPFTTLDDRSDGKFRPIYEIEPDLARLRGTSRRLATLSPIGGAAINALRVYTLGNGPVIEICRKDGKEDDAVAMKATEVIVNIAEEIGLPGLLNELHDRAREDGEAFLILNNILGELSAEIVEPDQITAPHDPDGLSSWLQARYGIDLSAFVPSWSFGILTPKRIPSHPLGYHCLYENNGSDWEFYPAAQVVHVKRNVTRNAKRGVTDWYSIYDDMRNEPKLARNMGIGAALQAAIAWVEELPKGTTSAAASSLTPTDLVRTQPTNINNGGGTRQRNASHIAPGTIRRVTEGYTYKPGPMGAERNGNFEIAAQYMLRRIGIRWNIPEYMISGDASNANFASTMVAESPFVKAREADQEWMRGVVTDLAWKALALAIGPDAVAELKRSYKVKVDLPQVQSRDPLELAQRLEIEKRNGWVSDKTAANELGRNYDEEQAQGAKSQFDQEAELASREDKAKQAAARGALESVDTTDEARAVLESMWKAYP